MNKTWTAAQRQYIRDNYEKMKDKEIGENLSKLVNKRITTFAVRRQRQTMGLKKAQGRHVKHIKVEIADIYDKHGFIEHFELVMKD